MPTRVLVLLLDEEGRRLERREQNIRTHTHGKKMNAVIAIPPFVD